MTRVGRKSSSGRLYRKAGTNRICHQQPPCIRYNPDFGWDGSFVTVGCVTQCNGLLWPTVLVARIQVISGTCPCIETYLRLVYDPATVCWGSIQAMNPSGTTVDDWFNPDALPTALVCNPNDVNFGTVPRWASILQASVCCDFPFFPPPFPSWTTSFSAYGWGLGVGTPTCGGCTTHDCYGNGGHRGSDTIDCTVPCFDRVFHQGATSGGNFCACGTNVFPVPGGDAGNPGPPGPTVVRVTITPPWMVGYKCDGTYDYPDLAAGGGSSSFSTRTTPCGCCGSGSGSGSGDDMLTCAECGLPVSINVLITSASGNHCGLNGESVTLTWDGNTAGFPFVTWVGTLEASDGGTPVHWTFTLTCSGGTLFFQYTAHRDGGGDCISEIKAVTVLSCSPFDATADVIMQAGCFFAGCDGETYTFSFSV